MKLKFLFTLAATLAIVTQVSAEPVTKQEALKSAQAFMQNRGIEIKSELKSADGPRKAAASNDANPYYYVFNNGDDGGFVIISGDDRTKKVIGYSDEGHFDLTDMNEATETVLAQYANEIDVLNSTNTTNIRMVNAVEQSQTTTYTAVQPLTTSKWSQIDPYNRSCPYYSSTKRCALGCTGVAMAQLIYYYRDRMPAKLQTSIPGYTCSHTSIKPSTISAGSYFYWNRMFDWYDGSQTTSQITATDNFLYWVSVSIASDFWSSTTAYFSKVGTSLAKYFGFSNGTALKRDSYTYAKWKSKIVNELEQGRPVFYYAAKGTSGGSHAFLVDGFDGGDLFHVNWGWGGKNNGYFALSILEPLAEEGENSIAYSTAYTYSNIAYFDLQPLNGYSNVDNATNLTSVINSVSGSTAKVTYTNYNTLTNSYTCGLGIRNASNNILVLKTWDKGEVSLSANEGTGAISYTLSYSDFKSLGLGAGTYKIFPICRLKNGESWVECDQYITFNYIVATLTSSALSSLTKGNFQASLSVSEIDFPGPCVKGITQPVVTTVKNTGDEFVGTLYLFASTTTTKGTRLAYNSVYIPKGKSINVQMNFTPKYAGTYNVWVATDASGNNVIGQSKVTVVSGTYSKNLAMTSISVKNIKSGKTILGTTFEGTVTVKNNASYACAEKVVLYLYSTRSGWITHDTQKPYFLELEPGESKVLPFKFENLGVTLKWGIAVMYPDNSFIKTNPYQIGYATTYAPMCYAEDGSMTAYSPTASFTVPSDAVAVDFTGTTGTITTVVPNSNPNTLYYVGSSETAINGLSGKNVIIGTSAANISLTNGKGFFAPKSFVAKNISFKLVPSVGVSKSLNSGWQTLTLPFNVSKVTCNNSSLDWFKSDTDTKKHFWIKEFSAIAGQNTVCWDYAQEIKANHPYLYAVPNSEWGSANNLVGKTILFSATNAQVYEKANSVTGSDAFNFRGSYGKQSLSNVYTLNSTGSKFAKSTTATVHPFSCYFVATSADNTDINNQYINIK